MRLLQLYSPTADDKQRVAEMPRCDCPRRYCWWWRSLSFDWNLTVAEGCVFLKSKKHPDWKHADVPCKRANPESSIDHYESRGPHLLEDGFPLDMWK
jgi:hypothetical protein